MKTRGYCKGNPRRTRERVELRASGTFASGEVVYFSLKDLETEQTFHVDMTPEETEELISRLEFALEAARRKEFR